jgi:hypothetical protein
MEYPQIPGTDLKGSRIALGTWSRWNPLKSFPLKKGDLGGFKNQQ